MKYILHVVIFIFIVCYLYDNSNNNVNYINASAYTDSLFVNDDNYKSHNLNINDTFSMNGSIVSTIIPNLTFDNNQGNGNIKSNSTGIQSINNTTANTNRSLSINNINLANQTNRQHNQKTIDNTATSSSSQLEKPFMPSIKSLNSNSIIDQKLNQSASMSDNLVSILSGILIQSIENGNPTINDNNNNNQINKSNTTENLRSNSIPIIISGKWNMDVSKGNITNFNIKFIMINADSSDFHWHVMNNFKSNEKLFLGSGDSAAINGVLDFHIGNNITSKKTNVLMTINNLELIQIVLLDDSIANHFHGFPLYGIIDSIKVKN